MPESFRFVISGYVQGVYFRQATQHEAQRLNLSGWVRNRDDGGVEGLACGEPEALDELRQWLQRGPSRARVREVDWQPTDETAEGDFQVLR